MSNIFFTADTHFGHANIIKYCHRPFETSEEMDEEILRRFNEVLKPGDVLYHLGDVSWSSWNLDKFFHRLNTKEVHLIWGNHDDKQKTKHAHIRSYNDIKNISVEKIRVVLCHYSMQTWSGKGKGAFHLFGHSHGTLSGIGRSLDVGVDCNNFYPFAWEDVKKKLENISYVEYD